MVFYECIITAKNTSHFWQLTNVVKLVSHQVVDGGGIVRAVHNHGVRSLPVRHKAKYPGIDGTRYYNNGRFFSIYYEANPTTMRLVEQALSMNEEVLRTTHLKTRSLLDFVKIPRLDRNPIVQNVITREERLKNNTITTATDRDDYDMDEIDGLGITTTP